MGLFVGLWEPHPPPYQPIREFVRAVTKRRNRTTQAEFSVLTVTGQPIHRWHSMWAPPGRAATKPLTHHSPAPRRAFCSPVLLSQQIFILISSHFCKQLDLTNSPPSSTCQVLGEPHRKRNTSSQISASLHFTWNNLWIKSRGTIWVSKEVPRPGASSSSSRGSCPTVP